MGLLSQHTNTDKGVHSANKTMTKKITTCACACVRQWPLESALERVYLATLDLLLSTWALV